MEIQVTPSVNFHALEPQVKIELGVQARVGIVFVVTCVLKLDVKPEIDFKSRGVLTLISQFVSKYGYQVLNVVSVVSKGIEKIFVDHCVIHVQAGIIKGKVSNTSKKIYGNGVWNSGRVVPISFQE